MEISKSMTNELLKNSLNQLNISYNEEQIFQFENYYKLLLDWNKKINLTAITEYEDVIIKHFIDSVLICKFIRFDDTVSLIDVGTGGGFPGIPIKILNPDCRIVLLDSLNKRVNFLNAVKDELKLKNIECIHGRAEDVSREKNYRECFDIAVSRAVANLSTLSEYCIPFLKTGGRFISYKSEKSYDEIKESENAIKCLSSEITSIEDIVLPNTDIVRKFIIITKRKPVSNKYPRKAGLPTKDPL